MSERPTTDPKPGEQLSTEAIALTAFLAVLPPLVASGHATEQDAREQRAQVAATIAALECGSNPYSGTVERALRGITPQDRSLLAEGLRVIEQWVRQPGEETGRQVDDVVARMRRELGPLIARDRAAEETSDRERLRVSVRESISRRLREARADNDAP